MRLTKLGHSCLLVEEGGARLLLDPGTLSAAGRSIHYRQLEQLGGKDGTTLRVLDDGAPAEL